MTPTPAAELESLPDALEARLQTVAVALRDTKSIFIDRYVFEDAATCERLAKIVDEAVDALKASRAGRGTT